MSSDIIYYQFHLNTQMKLIELKRRLREGSQKKITIVFFVTAIIYPFQLMRLVEKFAKDDRIIVKIYIFNELHSSVIGLLSDVCNKNYIEVLINHYAKYVRRENIFINSKRGCQISINSLKPDIVFITHPVVCNSPASKLSIKSDIYWDYLCCAIRYGSSVVDNAWYHTKSYPFIASWRRYASDKYLYELYHDRKHFTYNSGHIGTRYTGFVEFEMYKNNYKKYNNPTVLWSPHWDYTSMYYKQSSLVKLNDFFENVFAKYKNINFIFRIHPEIINSQPDNLKKIIDITKKYSNTVLDLETSNAELFAKSHLIINDSISFLYQYLPSNTPMVYMADSKNSKFYEQLSDFGKRCYETVYEATKQKEVIPFLDLLNTGKLEEYDLSHKKQLRKDIFNELNLKLDSNPSDIIYNDIIESIF